MIFCVEDDKSIRDLVIYTLSSVGYEAAGFASGKELFAALEATVPQLIMLDIMLPEEDGISVLKWLRSRSETKDLPIIMLTAKSSEYDKVLGLDSGADDYVAKPFGTMELISRIKALLRRTKNEETEYTFGGLYVNPTKHIVTVGGENVSLTLKEFEILCLMLKNRGTVLSRDRLLIEIWGYDYDGENRTVDVHIKTLRTKLKDCGALIETVRGLGYKIG